MNANVRCSHTGDMETKRNDVGVKWIHTDLERNHRQDYCKYSSETSGSIKGGEFLHLIPAVCYVK
jgi:hypothetical protein